MKSADLCAGEAFKALNAYRKACKCDDSSGHEVVSAYMMLSIMMASQIAENGSLGVAIGFLQSMNLTMSIRMAIRFHLERWDIHAFYLGLRQ